MRVAKNILTVIASLLFVAGISEAILRYYPDSILQTNNPYKYTRVEHLKGFGLPFGMYREIYPYDSNGRLYYKKTEGVIEYFSDQNGARSLMNVEHKYKENRVLVLGDSFTYGFGIRYEDNFISLLNKETPISWINLALPGADVTRQLTRYQEKKDRIPHQAVVYGLNINDLILFPTSFIQSNPILSTKPFTYSKLAEFILKRWDLIFGRRARIQYLLDKQRLSDPFFSYNFNSLLKLKEVSNEGGKKFVVILLPLFVDLQESTFSPLYAEIRKKLSTERLDFIDLTEGWSSFKDSELWITPYDQHPNEIANGIFAKRILESYRKFLDL